MTTGYIFLFPGGHATDGSGTGNNTAGLSSRRHACAFNGDKVV